MDRLWVWKIGAMDGRSVWAMDSAMDRSRVDGSVTNRVQGLGTGKGTDFLQWIKVGLMDGLEDLEQCIGKAFGLWSRATDRSRVDGSAANRVQVVGTPVREQSSCDGSK